MLMHKGKRPYITCALFSGFRKRGHNMRKEIGVISFVTRQNRWQWCWGLGASLLILLENRVTKKSLLTQLTLKRVSLGLKFPKPNCRFIKKTANTTSMQSTIKIQESLRRKEQIGYLKKLKNQKGHQMQLGLLHHWERWTHDPRELRIPFFFFFLIIIFIKNEMKPSNSIFL